MYGPQRSTTNVIGHGPPRLHEFQSENIGFMPERLLHELQGVKRTIPGIVFSDHRQTSCGFASRHKFNGRTAAGVPTKQAKKYVRQGCGACSGRSLPPPAEKTTARGK